MRRETVCGLIVGAILFTSTECQAERYRIDRDHSSVEFSIRHTVSRVTGRFTNFSGTIEYDTMKLDKSSVEVSIWVESIDTGSSRRDTHLKKSDFFDAKAYPNITFKSTKVADAGVGKLDVTGDFTMHGVVRSIVLPVEITGIGLHPGRRIPIAGFVAELRLNRSDYGVNSWVDAAGVLGDEVKIVLNIRGDASESDRPLQRTRSRRGRTLTERQLKDIQKRMFARYPALKREFEKAVKEDPGIETDQEKWMLFMAEMREKGVIRSGRGRR